MPLGHYRCQFQFFLALRPDHLFAVHRDSDLGGWRSSCNGLRTPLPYSMTVPVALRCSAAVVRGFRSAHQKRLGVTVTYFPTSEAFAGIHLLLPEQHPNRTLLETPKV